MAHNTTADGRYGLASGTRYTTIADKALDEASRWALGVIECTQSTYPQVARNAARQVVPAVRRLVRAALDVERQRAFEKGMEAFAAMPMVRERHDEGRSNRWTPGTHTGD